MHAEPVRRRAFLDSLAEQDRLDLLAAGRPHAWAHGEPVVRTGDPADSAIALLDGLVKIHRSAPDGSEIVLGISGPGDLLGEIAVLRGASRSVAATTLERVQAVVIPAPALRAFLSEHPESTLALLELTLARLHEADARRLEFVAAESLPRVASRLVELAERFGRPSATGGIDVALPITQEELASWSAASRESTARALRTLRGLGLIETHRLRLRVHDLDALRGHAARL